jgi:hypothetical protein
MNMGKKQAKRRLKKQLQRQQAAASRPQNLYQEQNLLQNQQVMPRVALAAQGVRAVLVEQQMQARLAAMRQQQEG